MVMSGVSFSLHAGVRVRTRVCVFSEIEGESAWYFPTPTLASIYL